MAKIRMTTPLVEMDGDEMTRIIWKLIKEELIEPFVDLKTEYFDLGLEERERTADQVTVDAAEATKRFGVAVKCATITPNAARMDEYHLTQMWKSPNGTIRALLDGTVFRAPILVRGIEPYVRTWKKPITIARHAYGDVYKNTELRVEGPGKVELVYTPADGGSEIRATVHDFNGAGIAQGIHNLDASIQSFARASFNYALDTRQDLWFATKDTISKTYDHRFKDIFQEVFDAEYRTRFAEAGIEYFYTLIDDAVRRRLYLGVQELRWRRDERHGEHGLWLFGHDDLGARLSCRLLRVRGRPWHRTAPLLQASCRRRDEHQLSGNHLRLDRRPCQARGAGQPARAYGLCPPA